MQDDPRREAEEDSPGRENVVLVAIRSGGVVATACTELTRPSQLFSRFALVLQL